jgi:hypothetical protein
MPGMIGVCAADGWNGPCALAIFSGMGIDAGQRRNRSPQTSHPDTPGLSRIEFSAVVMKEYDV